MMQVELGRKRAVPPLSRIKSSTHALRVSVESRLVERPHMSLTGVAAVRLLRFVDLSLFALQQPQIRVRSSCAIFCEISHVSNIASDRQRSRTFGWCLDSVLVCQPFPKL